MFVAPIDFEDTRKLVSFCLKCGSFNHRFSEGQLRVPGEGSKLRFLPLAPETTQLIDHYLRLERPDPCSAALFVVLKGPARGTRMTPAGLRSLFRYHRRTTGIQLANPHRFSSDTPSPRIWCAPVSACPHLCS